MADPLARIRRQSLPDAAPNHAAASPAEPYPQLLSQRRGSLSNDSVRSQHLLIPSRLDASADINGELLRARQVAPVHIVVADDDAITRKLILSWLSPRYTVTLCEDGNQALKTIKSNHLSNPVDLVLSDVSMPTTDGMQLLAEMRSDENLKNIPVILMSGVSNSASDANYSIAQGCEDYLIKPLIRNVVRKKIDTIVENIIQKRLLKSERNIRNTFESRVKRNQEKIRNMAQQISKMTSLQDQARDLVETPVSNIIRLIQSIEKKQEVINTPLAEELRSLLKALASTDLYRPSFQKLLDTDQYDSVTQSQLLDAFLPRSPTMGRKRNMSLIRSVSASAAHPLLHPRTDLGDVPSHVWGMNIWIYSFYDMEAIIANMFESFDLLTQFNISKPVLLRFIHTVRQHYFYDNPYHNFQHAFSVVQGAYSLLCEFELSKYLTNLDILSLLIAALCHDVEHPGLNNAFLIKSKSPLALRYNDIAVLENHHASMCFQILNSPGNNILANLGEDDFRIVRKTIIDSILATDMEQHFVLSSAFASVLPEHAQQNSKKETSPPEVRILILQLIMKCADISNIAIPAKVARVWFDRVADEFFAQGDAEKKNGKKPPPFMDRDVSSKFKISADFAKFVGRPLFETLTKFCSDSSRILDLVDLNLAVLEKIQSGIEEEKIGEEYNMDYVVHKDHLKQVDKVLCQSPQNRSPEDRVSLCGESILQKVLTEKKPRSGKLQRGSSIPVNFTFELDEDVFTLDGVTNSGHSIGKSWNDYEEFSESIPSTPSI